MRQLFRDLPRWLIVLVAMFWAASVLTEAATTALDPVNAQWRPSWPHFFLKRGSLAVFWTGITLAALIWYRDHPFTAERAWRGVLITATLAALACVLYGAYFGGVLVLLSAGQRGWWQGARMAWTVEMIYVYVMVWQIALAANAYHYYRRAVARQREAERLRHELGRMELSLLRAQLEPHFLFNALNSIASLVRLGRDEAAVEALNQLGALLRGVLEVGHRQVMPWQWEREFTRMYVALQRLRFGERLDVRLDADDLPADTAFPILLLQPLIENAIAHGSLNEARACRVEIALWRAQGRVHVRVSNDVGAIAGPAGHGVGQGNIVARLRAIHGERVEFRAAREDGRYVVTIAFPEVSAPVAETPA